MIIVDSSAAVGALAGGTDSDELRARLTDEELHAPVLIDYEFVSAVRKMTLRRILNVAKAEVVLDDFEDLPLQRWQPGHALRRRVYSLRDRMSAYDAAYISLAEALGCELVTRDSRLSRTAGHAVPITLY